MLVRVGGDQLSHGLRNDPAPEPEFKKGGNQGGWKGAGKQHGDGFENQFPQRNGVPQVPGGRGGGLSGKLLGMVLCQFDHIVWVTMTDDGPVMANLLLDGILDDEPCLR